MTHGFGRLLDLFFWSIAFGSFFLGWGDVFGGWRKHVCNLFGGLKREIHCFLIKRNSLNKPIPEDETTAGR